MEEEKKGECMECGVEITADDPNVAWNICNACRESVQ